MLDVQYVLPVLIYTNMVFDASLLNSLTAQAKLSPRHRQHYDLRDSEDENSQKMLNAIEPEAVLTIHKHPHNRQTYCACSW